MKAAFVTEAGPPRYDHFASPQIQEGGVIVKVCAAALTNLDIAIAEGRHYFSTNIYPQVIGREAVARLDNGRRAFFNVNSTVFPYGSMAELSLVRPEFGLPVPEETPDALAAAMGNAGLAAWLPLSWRAAMKPGEKVLILGATGASGLIAVSAARLLGAGRIIAAGRDVRALERAKRLGADMTVNLAEGGDLPTVFLHAAQGEVDIVLDYLNGPPAEAALQIMAKGGRMVQIGQMIAPGIHLPAGQARRQSLDVLGFAYYHAPLDVQAAAYDLLCRHAARGEIEIDFEARPLSDIAQAWAAQKSGGRTRQVLVP